MHNLRQARRCQLVDPFVQVTDVELRRLPLQWRSEGRQVTLHALSLELQVVGLRGCEHRVAVVYVLLPGLESLWELGK